MFSNFSYYLKRIINNSKKEMHKLNHSYIGTEHFFLALLSEDNVITKLLNNYGIFYDNFKEIVISNIGIGNEKQKIFIYTPLFRKILEESIIYASEYRIKEIDTDLIVKLILDEGEGVAYRIFCEMNINVDELYDAINNISIKKKDSTLSEYGVDLTEKAKKGLIDPVIGRDKEIDNIIKILLRKNKCNPLLIGDAGVGKTAIVENIADRIINSSVPNKLLNKKIISISMAQLVAGTKYRGEFEEKLLNIIKEIEKNNDYILFIDEIHTLVGAGGAEGAIDASNILKPALARGNIRIIGATTKEEYRKYIEDDKALSRRFQNILIEEPTETNLIEILKNIKHSYEDYHNVIINNNVIEYIIKISKKYLKNRKEPDRSIDLLDEVSSYVATKPSEVEKEVMILKNKLLNYKNKKEEMLCKKDYNNALKYRQKERKTESIINDSLLNKQNNNKKIINKNDVIEVINNKYNTFLDNTNELNIRLKRLYKYLDKETINKIKHLFLSKNKLTKPISLLYDCNESVINDISKLLFNNNIIQLDLNEFSDLDSYNRIIGYSVYKDKKNVFENLKEQPFNLIVIKNYEKACTRVKNIIKQIINNGYFIDCNGYKIDFINSLIIINNSISKSSIGFTKNNSNYYELFNYVSHVINCDKMKFSMV